VVRKSLSCVLCVLGCIGDLVNGARQAPELARAYAETEVIVQADFKKGLSMREILRRAAELDKEHGPAVRPPAGTALSGYVGKGKTAAYLARRDSLRTRYGLTS
jgi:hypothetical protein